MTTAFVHSHAAPWTVPFPPGRLRFGRSWQAADGSDAGLRWALCRNCSLTPGQLLRCYLSLCVVSLMIAGGFALHGAPVVLAFAGLELAALGLSCLIYARHATDADTVTLSGQTLDVEQTDGASLRRARFRAEWVSVEPAGGDGSLVEISGQGQCVRVGRFLRPEHRAAFARELRVALRVARDVGVHQPDPDQPV